MTAAFVEEACAPEKARVVLVPVPYERTTTYNRGTAAGPAALLEASLQVELFDEETRTEPLQAGLAVLEPVQTDAMPDVLAGRLAEISAPHLQAGRIVGCLGGEHSLSLGPIRAAAGQYPGLGVLQIDAHPDLRDTYEGTRYGHGCVMRRVLESSAVARLVQVGLRAVSEEDDEVLRTEPRVRPFYAKDLSGRARRWIDEVVAACPEKVYVSFDLDGLDPSVVPGTGTPEPGGLGWWEALALLRAVIEEREVVAFDIVELLPTPASTVSEFAAAKLLFKILAYLAARR
ncbi:MAG: agmatinase [Planctomycetota bacterium]